MRFVLHGGDGLELCGAGGSLGDATRFHAIDASNVGDHAGLLNVLVAAGPRLVDHPASHLTADTMTWSSSGASNMAEYLSFALGGPPALLPTLLGLRLVSDLRFGRPEPYSLHDRVATRSSNTRHLEFAPAVASAVAALDAQGAASSSSSSSNQRVNLHPGVAAAAAAAATSTPATSGLSLPLVVPDLVLPPQPAACGLSDALLSLGKLCCATCGGQFERDRSVCWLGDGGGVSLLGSCGLLRQLLELLNWYAMVVVGVFSYQENESHLAVLSTHLPWHPHGPSPVADEWSCRKVSFAAVACPPVSCLHFFCCHCLLELPDATLYSSRVC